MPPERFTRREFLKTLSILPLLPLDLSFLSGRALQPTRSAYQDPPNILILLFDTFSAKHMSLYGYPRETTPNINKFAERATVFHRHYAGGNFTTPGTASLLTGTYPWSHRALHLHGRVTNEYENQNIFSSLADQYFNFTYTHNPLAAILLHQFRDQIHQLKKISDLCLTADTFANKYFNKDFNAAYEGELITLRNGYDPSSSLFLSLFDQIKRVVQTNSLRKTYKTIFPRGVPNLYDEQLPSFLFFTLEEAIDWVTSRLPNAPTPYFGYVHLMPPHNDYTTRQDFVDIFLDDWRPDPKPEHFFTEGHPEDFLNVQRRYYDEYIAYVDAEFGRLIRSLEQSGILDDTYLILTSDHGEMFERGIYTHITPTLYEPIIRIPLLISIPELAKRRDVFSPTSCVDILPTVLHIIGQEIPSWCEGQVLPTFKGETPRADRLIYAVEAKENQKSGPLRSGTVALISGQHKLVHYFGFQNFENEFELYDIQEDPEELVDIYQVDKSVASDLTHALMGKLTEINIQNDKRNDH
jgi:arylsulfatase A-like enzyme